MLRHKKFNISSIRCNAGAYLEQSKYLYISLTKNKEENAHIPMYFIRKASKERHKQY